MKPRAVTCRFLLTLLTGLMLCGTSLLTAQEERLAPSNRQDSTTPAAAANAEQPAARDGLLGIAWAKDAEGHVILTKVALDSPFSKMDAHPGDIVVSVGGTPIRSGDTLDRVLRNLHAKEEVGIQLLRDGQPIRGTIAPPLSTKPRAGLFGALVELNAAGRIQITEVTADTPAAAAGLRPGDQIISIGDNRPHSLEGLGDFARRLVSTKAPGERINMRLLRNGQEYPVELVVPENSAAGAAPGGTAAGAAGPLPLVLGIAVKERGPIVVVTQVIPNDPAAIAGIRSDDIIQAVGNQQITSYATLADAIRAYQPGGRVPVHILRGQKQGVVDVVVGTREAATADVVLDASGDIAEIVVEVKKLKAQVNELGQIVQQLSQDVNQLKQQSAAAAQNAPR